MKKSIPISRKVIARPEDDEPPPDGIEMQKPFNKNLTAKPNILTDHIRLPDNSVRQIEITTTKYQRPLLNPCDIQFKGKYFSIRNAGGIVYQPNGESEILLFPTIRDRLEKGQHHSDAKSRIHIARSTNGYDFTLDKKPFIDLDQDSAKAVEDCRVVKIGEYYYLTFTAFKDTDKKTYNTTRIGYVKTKDFKTIKERGILLDYWGDNKNCVLMKNGNPEEIYVLHRPFFGKDNEKAKSYIAKTTDLKNFKNMGIFLEPKTGWEEARVGINTPPVNIGHGLEFALYHGAETGTNKYSLGGIIMDKNHPDRILWRSEEPIITPELAWEKGSQRYPAEVKNVVFTCNLLPWSGKFVTFHTGADRYTGRTDIEIKITR